MLHDKRDVSVCVRDRRGVRARCRSLHYSLENLLASRTLGIEQRGGVCTAAFRLYYSTQRAGSAIGYTA
jgi:hypothetical protein